MSRLVAAALSLAATSVLAQEAPKPDEVKRVWDYLENGKEAGPVLLDVVACNKVDQTKGSATLNQCAEPVTGPVKKGTTVTAWTQWFCPKDGKYEDVTFQWLHEGTVRTTQDATINGYGRTRTWRSQTLAKPGKWAVKIFRGEKELGGATFEVEK